MEVDVYYDDWHVGDGDAEIRVGARWTTTLLMQPIYALPYPAPVGAESQVALQLSPSPERTPALHALETEPAGCEFVADTVLRGRLGWADAPCSVLTVSGINFAVDEACRGRVSGTGRLWHDTYIVDDERVRSAASQEVEVTRVRFVEHVYRQVGDGDFILEAYRPPVDVGTTYARPSPWPPPGGFVITVDPSTARPLSDPMEAVGTDRTVRGWLRTRTHRSS